MNKKVKLVALLTFYALVTQAADVKVMQYKHAGPIEVQKPILTDSLNVNGKPFEVKNLLKSTISFEQALKNAQVVEADTAGKITFNTPEKGYALHLFSFFLNSDRYTKGTLDVSGSGSFEVYVDNKSVGSSSELTMEPRRYEVIIKYLTAATDTCPPDLKVIYKTKSDAKISASLNPKMRYTLTHMLEGKDIRGAELSPNGKYALIKYVNRFPQSKVGNYAQLLETSSGRVLLQDDGFLKGANWMPQSNLLYYTRTGLNGREFVTVDPVTLEEKVLCESLPEGHFYIAPNEITFLFSKEEEGPKESKDLIRVLEPSDRLPGFRNRSFIWRYNLDNGLFEQLTYGYNDTYINDISPDSRYVLFSTNERVYTSLPHSRNSLYKLDLQTMAVDTLWERAKYVNLAQFSPDGKQLLVSGSADAFDGIGRNVPEGMITNSYDGQMFLYDLESRKVTPLTKDFNPNV